MDPTNFVDNSTILPPTLFKKPKGARCAFFIQDAKMDMSEETMKNCEFGLGLSSISGKVWKDVKPFEKAFQLLNKRFPRIWLIVNPDSVNLKKYFT